MPKAISDLSTIESTLSVPDSYSLTDVNVTIGRIVHTFDADLDIYLVHPDATVVELSTDNGSLGDNYVNTVLDDEAATSITTGSAPFTGSYRPEGLPERAGCQDGQRNVAAGGSSTMPAQTLVHWRRGA